MDDTSSTSSEMDGSNTGETAETVPSSPVEMSVAESSSSVALEMDRATAIVAFARSQRQFHQELWSLRRIMEVTRDLPPIVSRLIGYLRSFKRAIYDFSLQLKVDGMAFAPSTLRLYDRMLRVSSSCVDQFAAKLRRWTEFDEIDPEENYQYWRPVGQEYGLASEFYLGLVALQLTLCCDVFRLGADYGSLDDTSRHVATPLAEELSAVSSEVELTALDLEEAWVALKARRQVFEILMKPDKEEERTVEWKQMDWTIDMYQCAGEIVRDIDQSLGKWITKVEE